MEKVGKTMIVSAIISGVIFGFCRYVNFYNMSICNVGYNLSAAFMFGVSYSALIWAYQCYRKMDGDTKFIRWIKETSFFYIHVVIGLCLVLVTYLGKEYSYYLIPVIVGCIIFPCFYFSAYYLTVKLTGNHRVGLIIGLVLCTVEFIQINFVDPADDIISYDVLNLFSGFSRLYYYDSVFWIIKILTVIVLMYIAAVTITEKNDRVRE